MKPWLSSLTPSPLFFVASHEIFFLLCLYHPREALKKMKDVYEKTPQMGDPASLEPRITETLNNIERLKLEVQKYEVREDPGEGRGRPAWLSHCLGDREVLGVLQLFLITALGVHG